MSQQLINHSFDLLRMRNEGYDIEVRSNYLIVKNVPYVNSNKEIKLGTLVSELSLAGDITVTPGTHVAYFSGDHPCNKDGSEISKIKHNSNHQQLAQNLVVHHSFSSKPLNGNYKDYYEKMTTYIAIISSPAQSLDSGVTAKTFPLIESREEESVFNYIDTASTRAGINALTKKLEMEKIAIVGLGGTGSYVLDLLAKTPVKEIHLFDGDKFLQHNAFRSPGAPSVDELRTGLHKVFYYTNLYSKMRKSIFPNPVFIDASNIAQLDRMNFVFLCLDKGGAKRLIVEKLEEFGIPFIDVGIGLNLVDDALLGVMRVTTSTVEQRDRVSDKSRIPFSDGDDNNEYSRNIQIADLNALNAALAVVKWKKLCGFYVDLEKEHHSTYTIDGNMLTNEDQL
ncbi:MAG: ThiF family adenylyltransferase [Scytonema sp. PMC 1069.18]|nr:ThiF family adenylyltransferase [Scytonema sp. PMC 1069.18]MEC4884578.1 ThiF family adenylyltransferase [Scytonema sp. PMC 1070.18]